MLIGLFQASISVSASEEVNLDIKTADGWSGSGYTVDASWGQFKFENWSGKGQYIYDKYDFTDDFSFLTKQMNVFGNTANILFCYQNDDNYYKLTIGTENTLSKRVNGSETILASNSEKLTGTEISLKIVHDSEGGITVTRGAKGGNGLGEDIFTDIYDTSLTHGKMGLSFANSAGYVAIMNFSGTADEVNQPTPTPTVEPTIAPTINPEYLKYETVYEQNFDDISDEDKASWVNVGSDTAPFEIKNGVIGGSDWSETASPIMIYKDQTFGNESYTYGVDLRGNYGQQESNSASILFNYTAQEGSNGLEQTGYAIELFGGTEGKVALKKYTKDMWNDVETIATYKHHSSFMNVDTRIEVSYRAGGMISADIIVGGTRYEMFSGIVDKSYLSGYIGVRKDQSEFSFDNVKVEIPTEVIPEFDHSKTEREGYGEPQDVKINPSIPTSGEIPEDWVSRNITLTDWGAFTYGAWGGSGYIYNEKYCWEEKFKYSVRMNNYSADTTTYMYFMYNDENNYYAVTFGGADTSGVKLIKKVNGTETVIAESGKTLKMADKTATVEYNNGAITVSIGDETYITGVSDKTLLSGFVGVGYNKGGFHANNFSVNGVARIKEEAEPVNEGYVKNFSVNHRTDKTKAGYDLTINNPESENIFAAIMLFDAETNRAVASKIKTSNEKEFSLNGEFNIEEKDYYAKAFVWESADTVKPLEEAKKVDFKKDEYKVLAIGNSFSQDAMSHLHAIAAADGVNMLTGNMYIGGCTIDKHWANAQSNNVAYIYEENGASATGAYDTSIKQALQKQDWDFVTLQQASPDCGVWSTYANIAKLAAYVKKYCPGAEIVIHQTWAYEKGSNHSAFPKYDSDQQKMFDALKDAYSKAAQTVSEEVGYDVTIIPSGEAFQIARNSEIGGVKVFDTTFGSGAKSLNRDGYHASQYYGRYLIGATWYEKLTGNAIADNSYRPSNSEPTDAQMTLLKNAAHEAVEEYK